MTKKIKHWRGRSQTTASVIKTVNKDNFASAICPTNVDEQKEKFLTFGKTPEFIHRGTEDQLEEIYQKPRSEIRFDLLGEAIHILKVVKTKYGDAENFYLEMYGERVGKEEATDILVDYLKENRLDGAMNIIWCKDLPCSGRMMWQGPHAKYKRPEDRKYSMWIKDAKDNNFLREYGMTCLADHEIGTHFFRSYNDGLQSWFSDRQRFGLRCVSSLESLRSEEGLAAINTILNAKQRFLWGPALLYYIACKASEMTFKQLFEHLTIYVKNPEWRWRHCVRVKRGLLNPNDIGGYGKDQCYFEGAVDILRNIDNIDFKILMSGKICFDEVYRVKKLARLNCIRMPAFMRDQEKYKKSLRQVAQINGLHLKHTQYKAPAAYIRRLRRGRRIGVPAGHNKVRHSVEEGLGVGGSGLCEQGGDSTEEEAEPSDSDQRIFHKLERPVTSGNSSSICNGEDTLLHESSQIGNDPFAERSGICMCNSIVHDCKRKPVIFPSTSAVQTSCGMGSESEISKQPYRCLSRASVISRLSMRSNSLNSRVSRNGNSDSIEYCRSDSSCSRASFSVALSQDDANFDPSDTEDFPSQKLYPKPPPSPMKPLRKYYTPHSTSLVPNTAECTPSKGQIPCTSTESQHLHTKGESQRTMFEHMGMQHSTDFQSTMSHRQFSVQYLSDSGSKRFSYQDGSTVKYEDRGKPLSDSGLVETREPALFTKGQPESLFQIKLLSLRSNSSANMLSE